MIWSALRRVRRYAAFERLCRVLIRRYGRLDVFTVAQIETAIRKARARCVRAEARAVLGPQTAGDARRREAFSNRYLSGRRRFTARDVLNAFAPRVFRRFDFPNKYVRSSPQF